jgi:hypothetical protein
MTTMKAIGYKDAGPISADTSFVAFETDVPQPEPHDLLVEVRGDRQDRPGWPQ